MSSPYERRTRTALGCSDFGWLPALAASTDPADMCSRSASAICDRALLPVHRNSTRGRRRGLRTRGARWHRRDATTGAALRRHPAAPRGRPGGRWRSSCRGDPPSCVAPSRARRRGAGAGGRTPSSAARRSAAINSRTVRSLCTSSRNNRHRSGCDASRTNRGGSSASESAVMLGRTTSESSRHSRNSINPILMHRTSCRLLAGIPDDRLPRLDPVDGAAYAVG